MVVFNELPQGLSGTLSVALCNFGGDTLLAQHMDIDVEASSSCPSTWPRCPNGQSVLATRITWALTRSIDFGGPPGIIGSHESSESASQTFSVNTADG